MSDLQDPSTVRRETTETLLEMSIDAVLQQGMRQGGFQATQESVRPLGAGVFLKERGQDGE